MRVAGGDSGGDPFGVGGFPVSRIVPSFSSLIQAECFRPRKRSQG